jgi:hypothetical protein
MPIEKNPSTPLPLHYIPPGGRPYRVKTSDDLESIARMHGIQYRDLVVYNFGTTDPAEINWYLRRNVGCTCPTHDRKNWMFTSDAQPGIIYLPPPNSGSAPVPNASSTAASRDKAARSDIWFGIGAQTGGHLAIAGKDTLEACIYSIQSYNDRFWLNVDGYRLGPGLGGSIGAVLVIVSHLSAPNRLQGQKLSSFDFQAAMVGKWGDLAKDLKSFKAVQRLASAGHIIDKTMSLLEYEKTREAIMTTKEVVMATREVMEESEQPVVSVIPIPFAGAGAELSLYWHWGSLFVHDSTVVSQ